MKLSDLDTAILAALDALKTAGTLRSVEAASMPAGDAETWLASLGTKAPFAAALYGGGSLTPINPANGDYKHQAEYIVLIGVNAARKRGDAGDLNTVIAAVMLALAGQTLSLEIKPLVPTGIDPVSMTAPALVYAIRFSVEFKWSLADEAA
jgi:hypothetical protein